VIERRATVPGDAAQLSALTEFLRDFWSSADLAPAQFTSFELALEEVFTNIVMHGSQPGRVPQVEVSLVLAGDGLTMTVEDDGPQFDPLSLPPPDITAGLEDRPVGGLGVFLIRQIMDAVSYQRIGTRNQLRITKHVTR